MEISENADDSYDMFLSTFTSLYNQCFPLKSVLINKRSNRRPWMTPDLLKLCRKRLKMYRNYKKHPTEHLNRKYKRYRNFVTIKLRQAKSEYYQIKFNGVKNNIKATWRLINQILRKNGKISQISSISTSEKVITDDVEIANEFNEFFVNIGQKLLSQQSVEPMDTCTFDSYLNRPNIHSIFFNPIVPSEILDVVSNMKNNTSSGIDDISICVVKKVISIICRPLCQIFNISLSTGVVPKQMKIARVTPIHKQGKNDNVNNYRPISVLALFDKILERCVYNRLIAFVDKHSLLFKNQFGFRKGHSTSTAILEFINHIYNAIDKKEHTLAVFIDLSKAFDVIDHSILLYKLSYYGIRGLPLKWIASYLSEREQLTVVNGSKSQSRIVGCGVPQGSILGPLLFLLYINDLPYCTQSLNYLLFADDTSIFMSSNDIYSLFNSVNIQLKLVKLWMKANKLILNIDKTKCMLFTTSKKKHDNLALFYDNRKLELVQSTKFLGIFVDSKLSWNVHVNYVCNKMSKNIGVLSKLQFLPKNILKMLYDTLILPYLSYCSTVWGYTTRSNLKQNSHSPKKGSSHKDTFRLFSPK